MNKDDLTYFTEETYNKLWELVGYLQGQTELAEKECRAATISSWIAIVISTVNLLVQVARILGKAF